VVADCFGGGMPAACDGAGYGDRDAEDPRRHRSLRRVRVGEPQRRRHGGAALSGIQTTSS
jgi:hypothetical protein